MNDTTSPVLTDDLRVLFDTADQDTIDNMDDATWNLYIDYIS